MRPRSRRAGRPDGNERIRDLVALLSALSRTGDSVSIKAISSRLGVNIDEARILMDIVCQASGEETTGLLISCNDDETEYTLQFPGVTGRPIRLTEAESIAINHALDVTGITDDDPLRQKLRDAYVSPAIEAEEVRRALGNTPSNPLPLLALCAQAQVENRALSFLYQGIRDAAPRWRKALIQQLVPTDDTWHIKAIDLNVNQGRTFRIDRMSDAVLNDEQYVYNAINETEQQVVQAVFTERTYYELFEWPGLTVISDQGDCIICNIAYYGEVSGWLERRIAACEGTLVVEDESIMRAARYYALSELG